MNKVKRWILETLTVNDMVEYFHEIGIGLDLSFNKKPTVKYYVKDSRLYKVKNETI